MLLTMQLLEVDSPIFLNNNNCELKKCLNNIPFYPLLAYHRQLVMKSQNCRSNLSHKISCIINRPFVSLNMTSWKQDTVYFLTTKAQFRCQTFHELNLLHWINMKNRNTCFNLERFRFFFPGPAGNFTFRVTLECLWFRHRTSHVLNLMHINYYNVFCK